MIIPVRVPHDAPLHTVAVREIKADHPLWGTICPACGIPFTNAEPYGVPVALVYVGAAPEDRKDGGWMVAGSVAVHAVCAGVREEVEMGNEG